jgi:esterase/lipase superfamily enzyme
VGVRATRTSLHSVAIGAAGDVMAYGNYGRPLLAFPSENGRCTDYADRGMVDAVGWLIEDGRVKVYCVDSFDASSWLGEGLTLEEKAAKHQLFEDWIINQVVPWIHEDCSGPLEIIVTGCSFGAFHAANFALKRADLFPLAICQSGVYDMSALGSGERRDAFYFNNPVDYVANLHGDHLEWLKQRLSLVLVCGRGQWEDATGALESTIRFGALVASKSLRHEVDLWSEEYPHDWPSWRSQIAHHLPRFC